MKLLSDENLIETYYKAYFLKLDEAFIRLLEQEISRRQLKLADSPYPIRHLERSETA